jgi:hypothetical protein
MIVRFQGLPKNSTRATTQASNTFEDQKESGSTKKDEVIAEMLSSNEKLSFPVTEGKDAKLVPDLYEARRCRLTVSTTELKARLVSTISA